MRPLLPSRLFSREVRWIHCLGVGGMGVAPLAIYLAESGYSVSGEDDALPEEVGELLVRSRIAIGPIPAACDLIVYSSAIAPDHPVYAASVKKGLPLVRRGEMLAEILRDRKLVAICGAHGKTTTAAMAITALRRANFSAGYLLGGLFGDGTPPARVGSTDWVVAEIDESDGTIDLFSPEITVAVNLDWDHPDHYRKPAEFEAAFARLFGRSRTAVLSSDACPRSLRLTGESAGGEERPVGPHYYTFGRSGDFSGLVAEENSECMTLRLGGRFPAGEAVVRARGDFNAANATAALAAANLMGVAPSPRALADYAGVRRRQAVLSTEGGATVVEDYAHHPTEIRALLGSLRQRLPPEGRLIVIFQPHRFSRTAQFKAEFAAALALADRVHLLDVYSAGEAPVAGGTTADIYAEMKRGSGALSVDYLPGAGAERFRALTREVRPGDWVAFVGAGDIDRAARAWLDELRAAAGSVRRWDEFAAAAKSQLSAESKVRREEPLAGKTTLRVGGAARVYAEPASLDDLRHILRIASEHRVPIFMLGRGSNLIVPDEGVEGLVICLFHPSWAKFEPRDGGRIWAGAGLRLKNLCGLAVQAGLAGFEFLEGIPGNVGGALRMNAGAMGGWIFDVVEEIEIMTMTGETKLLRKSELHLGYRHCAELHHAIALGALLHPVAKDEAEAIGRQLDVYRRKRHETQPREPSAGCIFKNPPGESAGKLIDESGFKGERVGDAEISAIHANFIVNRGNATSADVIELIRRVRSRVKAGRGIELKPEVLIYGKTWEEVL